MKHKPTEGTDNTIAPGDPGLLKPGLFLSLLCITSFGCGVLIGVTIVKIAIYIVEKLTGFIW